MNSQSSSANESEGEQQEYIDPSRIYKSGLTSSSSAEEQMDTVVINGTSTKTEEADVVSEVDHELIAAYAQADVLPDSHALQADRK